MTRNAHPRRISVATSLARFAALGCLMVVGLALCGCQKYEDLVQVETEKEANHVLTVLASAETRASQQDASGKTVTDTNRSPILGHKSASERQRKVFWQITVPAEDLQRARQVLEANDLPRERRPGLAALASGAGLIPTRTDERARLMAAIAAELERTLETIDGVVSARVHVTLPEGETISKGGETTKEPPTASVLLKTNKDLLLGADTIGLTPDQRSKVKEELSLSGGDSRAAEVRVRDLVAGAVEGITPDHIKVQINYTQLRPLPQAQKRAIGDLLRDLGSEVMTTPNLVVVAGGAFVLLLLFFGFTKLLGGRPKPRPTLPRP